MTTRNETPPTGQAVINAEIVASIAEMSWRLDKLEGPAETPVKKDWPQVDDKYWFISFEGMTCNTVWEDNIVDNARRARGNISRTKDEAQKADQVLLCRVAYQKAADAAWVDHGVALDWSDRNQNRSQVYWDHSDNQWEMETSIEYQTPFAINFPTKESALSITKAIDAEFPGVLK